ncbi:MAG: 2-amino-4-hydroxy-6-hydroxymethyldihydropteridine diphosphokinase [bacterium]
MTRAAGDDDEAHAKRDASDGEVHIVLSLGSNIDRERNLRRALVRIEARFGRLERSPVYETAAVGFDGPPFYNLVVGFRSDDAVARVRDQLRRIEADAGRGRAHARKVFENRALDIDILLYGDHDLRAAGYNIPRDEIARCAYVLKPLADLYPDLALPRGGETMLNLWRRMRRAEQAMVEVEFAL